MSDSTRRGFLKIAGTGVAAVGAAAVVPAVVGRDAKEAKEAKEARVVLPKEASGSLMAHVEDLQKGELTVMVEGREVTVTDHQLVARLAHALHTATSATQA